MRKLYILAILCFCGLLVGCQMEKVGQPAPVEVVSWRQIRPNEYVVKPGDTMYSVAWTYGMDFRELAYLNRVPSPYTLQPGQILQLRVRKKPVTNVANEVPVERHPAPTHAVVAHRQPTKRHPLFAPPKGSWHWPVLGKVSNTFSMHYPMNAGIDITSRPGATVHAAAPGQVVYSGHGIRGYGNLLIIKNSNTLLSAYAYNRKLLVQVGDQVQRDQAIAQVGRSPSGKAVLHFEIRRAGKPVNPRVYLS